MIHVEVIPPVGFGEILVGAAKIPLAAADAANPTPTQTPFNTCERKICTRFHIADQGRPADAWLLQSARWTWQVKLAWQIEGELFSALREHAEALVLVQDLEVRGGSRPQSPHHLSGVRGIGHEKHLVVRDEIRDQVIDDSAGLIATAIPAADVRSRPRSCAISSRRVSATSRNFVSCESAVGS